MLIRFSAFALFVIFGLSTSTPAQTGALGQTWKGSAVGAIHSVFAKYKRPAKTSTPPSSRTASKTVTPPARAKVSSPLKFVDSNPSGIPALLADALGSDAAQKKTLSDAFDQLLAAYNAEMRKENKANDLAAALTFFIVANVATYTGGEPISDADAEELYSSIASNLEAVPAVAAMSNAEKHRMHDWLAVMSGFIHASYLDSKNRGSSDGLAVSRELAVQSTKLVLGIDLAEMAQAISAPAEVSTNPDTGAVANSPIIGVWTAASSSPAGTSMGLNAGTVRSRYTFNADGTYAFKSEVWGGYTNSNMWWTTEETGTYSIAGDSLTIAPRTNKATLRNLAGVVQKTQNNPLEKVTYKWTTHYFSGIQETNLVLAPPRKTNRDGVMGGNSLFPNAYLYKQGDNLAWRY